MSDHCNECGTLLRVPYTLAVRQVTCHRCGTGHYCNDGQPVRKVYPALRMHPIDQDGVESKWMPHHTRPLLPGFYFVRQYGNMHTEVRARWDGRTFDVRGVQCWKGVLA